MWAILVIAPSCWPLLPLFLTYLLLVVALVFLLFFWIIACDSNNPKKSNILKLEVIAIYPGFRKCK